MSATAAVRPREIWTRLTVDPLADPLSRVLARAPGVTPNRVTVIALALGVGAAASFATGHLRWGGVLFVLRFFADCLDGKIARLQGSGSHRGAALDLIADVTGVTLGFCALSWWLIREGHLAPEVGLLLIGSLVLYNWVLEHRKHLARELGAGTGGFDHTWRPAVPLLGSWVAFSQRLGMSAVPWAVEAEIAALGLAPLFLPPDLAARVLMLALAFYVVANLVNLRRVWRLAGLLDRTGGTP